MLQSSCSSLLSEPRDPMSSSGWGHLRCKETFASDNRPAVAAGLRSVNSGHFKETVLDDALAMLGFRAPCGPAIVLTSSQLNALAC